MNYREIAKKLWETLLKTDVTDETDFFESGGNSLYAVLLAKQIEEKTDIRLKVTEIYRCSVFSDFCAMLETIC